MSGPARTMPQSDAAAKLQGWINRLRELADTPEAVAPKVAEALKAETARTIAAGTAPDGTAWKPTQDGKQPLKGAAKALRAASSGSVALLVLEGPEVLHHEGRAKGGIRRQILPSKKLNATAIRAVKAVITDHVGKVLDG